MSSQTDFAPPQPTAEHKKIMDLVGTWNVECSFYMEPGKPPMKVDGKDVCEAFGPFWVRSNFSCTMFGAPFQGFCTMGYDPESKQYVSTWIDTMSPSHFLLKGKYDAAGKVLEMRGRGFDCMMKMETDYRTREEIKGPNERVFEMFSKMPDGTEVKMFTHVYKRAGGKK